MAVIFVFGVLLPSFMSKKEPAGEQRVEEEETKPAKPAGEETVEAPVEEGKESENAVPAEGEAGQEKEEGAAELPTYPEKRVELKTPLVEAVFSTKGAALVSYELQDPHFYVEKKSVKQNMVSRFPETQAVLPQLTFRADSAKTPIPEDLSYRLHKKTEDTLVFISEYGPWRIKRWYRIFDDYKISTATTLTNIADEPITVKPAVLVRLFKKEETISGVLGWLNPKRDIPGGMCNLAGDQERKDIKKLHKEKLSRAGDIYFVAVNDLYFVTSIMPLKSRKIKGGDSSLFADQASSFGCTVTVNDRNVIVGQLFQAESNLAKGESTRLAVTGYIGSKEYQRMSDFGYDLKTGIDYGWFGSLSIFFLSVLKTLHSWVGNWGLAIILLTLIIKIVLLPLTHWSYVSMRNMSAVKPLIDEINKKFGAPEDKEKKQQAMMELYKAHKINPMMGCFPMLLQMPIWISLYSMLARSVELYHTPFFLWITDLSQRDPYFILPVVLGASMFLQQKLTPTTADSQQAKMMMYFMPVMFMGFMLFLPAGLNLYILVSTVLTIVQQKFLYKPKVATAVDQKVRLMSDIDQKELSNLKKDKTRKSKNGKRN